MKQNLTLMISNKSKTFDIGDGSVSLRIGVFGDRPMVEMTEGGKDPHYSGLKTPEKAKQAIAKLKGIKKEYAKEFKEFKDKKEKYKQKVYHNTYGSAIDEAEKDAKSRGYELDQDDYNFAFGDAFFKPKEGQTRSKSIGLIKDGKEQKKSLHVQIYNRGNGKFEYNAYVN